MTIITPQMTAEHIISKILDKAALRCNNGTLAGDYAYNHISHIGWLIANGAMGDLHQHLRINIESLRKWLYGRSTEATDYVIHDAISTLTAITLILETL